MRRQPVVQVDAFAERAFVGNPAAVCVLDGETGAELMQQIAMEMNLSETAFLRHRDDGSWDLRWFTPTVEVDLCGHATLASAHVLWHEHGLSDPELVFATRSGVLRARQQGDAIELNFPAVRGRLEEPPAGLLEALGAPARTVIRNRMDWLVELESAEVVRQLAPDMQQLSTLPARGVIVTAQSDDTDYDFISRFFGPGSGVPEDPVTGSAHCALAPFWADRLGRTSLRAFQASARGGAMNVVLEGDRVRLLGKAVTVMRGELVF
ncbi:MAG TPA: PhzF family phenazine biosynthesis protein [Gemmatimonadales bacterium]|nr:PhzF family phenazine biosynthesis protein [Gemmatimonadales bacterium]